MKSIAKVVYPPRDKSLRPCRRQMDQVRWSWSLPWTGSSAGLRNFSVPDHVPAPPSLQNILKRIAQISRSRRVPWSDLLGRAKMLLLNSGWQCLQSGPNGHAGQIWEPSTTVSLIIIMFCICCDQGGQWVGGACYLYPPRSYAVRKGLWLPTIDIWSLESAHPSPLSAYQFFDQPFFSKA